MKSILPKVAAILAILPGGFSSLYAQSSKTSSWQPQPTGPIKRIAFGSCAKHWQAQPIWDEIIEKKPDLFLFLGDNIYGDTDGKTAWTVSKGQMAGEWNRLADKPEFQRARAAFPFMATWDNHDYGTHAGGGEFPLKEEMKEVFLDFFEEPKASLRWKRSGIYDAKIIGPEGKKVQIVLLDTKFSRSSYRKNPEPKEVRLQKGKVGGYFPDDDPGKTHLGAEQWAWLERELKKPADLRLICSSIQVIPDQKGMDEWGNFPHERQRLLRLVEEAGKGIILSGNVHFAEVSRDVSSGLFEFTSSGMTHINELYGKAPNKYRVGEPFIGLNVGMIDIDWSNESVSLSVMAGDGQVVLRQDVGFGEDHRKAE